MKKLFFLALTLMLLGALCVIGVAAYGTPGFYCGGSEENFSSVGDVQITWDPDAADKLDLRDGDLTDWLNAGYPYITITPENMISWVGGSWDNPAGGVPEGWSVSAFYVADSDYLYIALYVVDPDVVLAATYSGYDGDAFQMLVDFDRFGSKVIEEDPEQISYARGIFYSFSPTDGGAAPIQIMRQESDDDRIISEENGDGVKGSMALTDSGWFAEFAFTWDQLYYDFAWKTFADDYRCEVSEDDPLEVGCTLYYLDRIAETGIGSVAWAAGTLGEQKVSDRPEITWSSADNGIRLFLEYRPDLEINCRHIHVMHEEETTVPERYYVVFLDHEDDVISTDIVEHGCAATAPDVPSIDGYNFVGWDTDFSCVTSDVTVRAMYEKEPEEIKIDPTRLTSFPEDIYKSFFAAPNQTDIIFNTDGSVTFQGTWDEYNYFLDPFVSFNYGNLMRRYVDKKLQNVPNRHGEYSSLVLKVKIDESVAGNFLMYYAMGRGNSTIDGSNVAYPEVDAQVGADGYQYIIFDLDGYPFTEDVISLLRFDWVEGEDVAPDNIGASMTLYEICLYEDFETALVACGIEEVGLETEEGDTREEPADTVAESVEPETEVSSESETVSAPGDESGRPAETRPGGSFFNPWGDEDNDDGDDKDDRDDRDEDDDDEDDRRSFLSIGCSGVILSTLGTSLMAVLAAAWVLRKKED